MSDLISRSALIKELDALFTNYIWWIDFIKHFVEKAPAVDAVEVVRCKDCKWWDDSLCTNINGAFCVVENGDWFCASGERKGDE
jgi:hypothetical protein